MPQFRALAVERVEQAQKKELFIIHRVLPKEVYKLHIYHQEKDH
ncbi:17776_t:CDS:2 [Cetraspora pellucida]|uniref:17776_t:CDS:1 n=1 Tax=Cetraspora pellucida TaxID=1433469 RepID=A0A9N8ZX28_9GLOM|nr:17776_t:CDS:2 [Cetraspora pellucida]